MRTTIKFSVAFAVFCTLLCAQSEVLLWQVNQNPVSGTTFSGEAASVNWDYAMIRVTHQSSAGAAIYQGTGGIMETLDDEYASGGSEILPSYLTTRPDDDSWNQDKTAFGDTLYDKAVVDLSFLGDSPSAAYFYIELYDTSNMLIGFSQAESYADLSQFRNTSNQYIDWTTYNAWNGQNWTIVPEPSSALLLVFGLAFAGLRRKVA